MKATKEIKYVNPVDGTYYFSLMGYINGKYVPVGKSFCPCKVLGEKGEKFIIKLLGVIPNHKMNDIMRPFKKSVVLVSEKPDYCDSWWNNN